MFGSEQTKKKNNYIFSRKHAYSLWREPDGFDFDNHWEAYIQIEVGPVRKRRRCRKGGRMIGPGRATLPAPLLVSRGKGNTLGDLAAAATGATVAAAAATLYWIYAFFQYHTHTSCSVSRVHKATPQSLTARSWINTLFIPRVFCIQKGIVLL